MKIWLIGYMGSGKSTLASRAGAALQVRAMDTDEMVVQTSGLSIDAMFRKHGARYFRVFERQVAIQFALWNESAVIATGGGMPIYSYSIREMSATGRVVFLRTDPDILWERVSRNSNRPLVREGRDAFFSRYEARLPIYQQADDILDSERMSQEEMVHFLSQIHSV